MLLLQRKLNESIVIDGGRIVIKVTRLDNQGVKLGFIAPAGCVIDREEVHQRKLAGVPPPNPQSALRTPQ